MTASTPATGTTLELATAGTRAVEIKVTIRTDQQLHAVRLFELERGDGEAREVYFFDTPQLDLFRQGVILRARLVKGGKDDSTVKIRPVDPAKIVDDWKKRSGFKLEADAVGEKVVRSASLSAEQKAGEIRDVATGKRDLRKLFSLDQESFLAAYAPMKIDFSKLKPLGPVQVLRWSFDQDDVPYDLTAEEWRLPDGKDLLEVSIKVEREEAAGAREIFETFLRGLGLDTEGAQETKTRVALEYFAAKL
jgi:adenylate cyclase class IV